ncbi:uncharacterized protein LOC107981561 [Nasonia vitripennis]|uniref:Uncharacterized protein n=1 Tax=Nasonia vitripennis TaxID=7425 RepID=A0A7M7TB40_NASVI|nr:uncharacterized protein LOC107981561 [Nasonia vitripennis]
MAGGSEAEDKERIEQLEKQLAEALKAIEELKENSKKPAPDNNSDADKQRSSDPSGKRAGHQERGGKWVRRRQFYAAKRQQKWLNKKAGRRLHEAEKECILQEESCCPGGKAESATIFQKISFYLYVKIK